MKEKSKKATTKLLYWLIVKGLFYLFERVCEQL